MAKRKMNPASLDNLSKGHPFDEDTARKANQKSHEAKKIYRPLKDIVAECLDEETVRAIMAALTERALKGDVRAWETLRDSSGQKPKEEVQMDNTVRLYFDDPDAEDFSG
ncbi:MAG: hypothetical protein IJJ80_08620 [Clostridia bacterium]|nr:hypothetical protein [Clostridia bacterium]